NLLGEQFQAALGELIGDTAKAERGVELEFADHSAARLQFAQDAVGRTPDRRLHKPGDGTFQPALAGDRRLLNISVVAFDLAEVLPEEFVMVEVALDKLPHVFP